MPEPSLHSRYAIRLDGAPVEAHDTYEEALAAARAIKRESPDHLVTVWDTVWRSGEIIQP